MKLTHYIYISTALATFAACSDDDDRVYTVGEADNAIVLQAGAYESGENAVTRAAWDTENDNARHAGKHVALESGIKLQLQVIGTWTDKSPETIIKEPTAIVGTETSKGSKHNNLTISPKIYWDDYGTADPNNESNRLTGLTIFGVGVNDKSVSTAPKPNPTSDADRNWQPLSWNVVTKTTTDDIVDQNDVDWSTKDLIISNNVQKPQTSPAPLYDGTLKFDDWKKKDGSANDLLEFKHAMSKITINLMANRGFSENGRVGKTTYKFGGEPEVWLLGRDKDAEGNTIETAYAITSGSVSIQDGIVTESTDASAKKIIKTKLDKNYPEWPTTTPETTFKYTTQHTALIFPGTVLGANPSNGNAETGVLSDAQKMTIAKIAVDGNVYYISAKKISEKLKELDNTTFKAESGKNYILNIVVDMTEVHVYATVVEWANVDTEQAFPKIDITKSYGSEGNAFKDKTFSFYYSSKFDDTSDKYGIASSDYYKENAVGTSDAVGKVSLTPEVFWPNHSIKYFFRGVWPQTKVDGTTTSPAVTVFTDDSKNHQGILVSNSQYEQGTFPSDLLVGIPLQNEGGKLKTDANGKYIHDENNGQGISATEGKITLNFTYRMAQVEVHLVSSGADKADNVDFGSETGEEGSKVTVRQAEVSIANGYSDGYILLSDGSAIGNTKGTYLMNLPKTETTIPTPAIPSVPETGGVKDYTNYINNKYFHRHDAIVPQSLTGPDGKPLQFVIKAYNEVDDTVDNYYINIKDIIVKTIDGASYNKPISAWEPGKHYVYTLNITKTQVTIEATIQDWIPVYAEGDFWLGGGAGILTR